MYAKKENGQIKRYLQLPENYKNWGRFYNEPKEVIEAEGFFPVCFPPFDPDLQERGSELLPELVEIEDQKYYTYAVTDKPFNLEEKKEQCWEDVGSVSAEISGIKDIVVNLHNPWGDTPGNIPAGFKDLFNQKDLLLARAKSEINGLGIPTDDENEEEALLKARKYVVRGPEIEGYINALRAYTNLNYENN